MFQVTLEEMLLLSLVS